MADRNKNPGNKEDDPRYNPPAHVKEHLLRRAAEKTALLVAWHSREQKKAD